MAKLTQRQIGQAHNLVTIKGMTVENAIALVKRRSARLSSRAIYVGSVAKAVPFAIV